MKLRTRSATSRTSRRTAPGTATTTGTVRCELCGRDVVAGNDGRCLLGHRLPAASTSEPTPDAVEPTVQAPEVPTAVSAPEPAAVPDVRASQPSAAAYLAELGGLAGPAPAAPAHSAVTGAVATAERPVDDPAPQAPGQSADAEAATADAPADDWSELSAEELAAEDARRARRQRVATITGGAIFGMMTFGALALAVAS